jgi:transcriptional regulator with XRE-family HTH domain
MFEPLPSFVRLQRERQNFTQERLAKIAKVSRGQLVAFEKGEQNVTLSFLLKIATALNLTELPIGEVWLRAAPPDFTTLILAADAIATARKVLSQAADGVQELEAAADSVKALVERTLSKSGADARVTGAVERLAATPTRGLRELAESPASRGRTARPRSTAKAAERKRSR